MKIGKKIFSVIKVMLALIMILISLAMLTGTCWFIFFKKDEDKNVSDNTYILSDSIEEIPEIKDVEPPVIIGIEDKEINVGQEINLLEGIEAKDNTDEKVDFIVEGEVDITKVGEYIIKIIAKDDSGNISEGQFKVIVKEIEETTNNEIKENKDKNENNESQSTSEKENNINTNNENIENPDNNNNSNSDNNTSSNNNTNTETPTLTGTDTVTELTNTEIKYGVQIKTYTTTVYNVYSDGSKTIKSTKDRIEYDRSNYSATTSELIAEAKTMKSKYSGMINQVVNNTNSYRQTANANGESGVTNRTNLLLDNQLCIAANVRAVEMAYSQKFSHTRPNGSSCFTVVKEMGISYSVVGENIAMGQTSANSVSDAWKNSSGHYQNMIDPSFSKIGVGVCKIDGDYYWVQLFT